MNLGIIGTSWITAQFVDAGHKSNTFKLTHVYSRTEEKAQSFYNDVKTSGNISTDLEDFFSSTDFDVVYIASPNSLHFKQVKMAIEHDKNVIVEKPSFTNPTEFAEIEKLLDEHNVFFFEAARHIHEKGFKNIQKYVSDNMSKLSGASLSFMKYSSKYDAFLAGENPNVFSPEFSGGAMYDLGVYTVYDAIVWFGKPKTVSYDAEILSNGIDGSGVATLKYDNFDVNILTGKTKNSHLPSEIYFGKDTLVMDNGGTMRKIEIVTANNNVELDATGSENPMVDEATEFLRIINEKDTMMFKKLFDYARDVNQVIYDLRKSAGIDFAAD